MAARQQRALPVDVDRHDDLDRHRHDRIAVVLPWGFTRRSRDAVDRILMRATDRMVIEMTIEEDWTP